MRIAARIALLFIAALLVFATVSYLASGQPRRDAVAAAEREVGVALESRRVAVGDLTLHVVLAGDPGGAPVLLLHGFPEFWYAWRKVMPPLVAAGFRVIAPDQRGYNDSDKPAGVDAYRVETLAGDVAALIAALGYEQANLVGHDWGGAVAWHTVIRHPERVRRFAVIDTPHPQAGEGFESAEQPITWFRTFMQLPWLPEITARLNDYGLLASNLRATSAPGTFPDDVLDQFRSAWDRPGAGTATTNWYRAAFRYPPRFDGEQRVAVPTLVIVAPHDRYIPGDLTRRSTKFLDNGGLVELQRGTHWVIQEEPAVIGALLIDFFAAPPGQPPS